jgi:hypothetical protein
MPSPNEKPTTVITIDEEEFDFDNLTEEIERTLAQVDAPKKKKWEEEPPAPRVEPQSKWPMWILRL